MVEEGGVEPPFFPNFTMQLSCELIRAFNPCRSLRAPCIPATSKLLFISFAGWIVYLFFIHMAVSPDAARIFCA
jgi:hypothetical protein